MRPEPWPGDMMAIRHHDALADAIINISSRIELSDGDGNHLKFSFASQRWRNAETTSIIRSPTYPLFKHPANRKPPDPGTKDRILEQATLAEEKNNLRSRQSCPNDVKMTISSHLQASQNQPSSNEIRNIALLAQ